MIILPETGSQNATTLISRIQTELSARPQDASNGQLAIGVSYGIATTEEDDLRDSAMLLKKADERLYASKKQKKGSANE